MTPAAPRISICVPTYRRPRLLREALESCLRQTLAPYEILVGDDDPEGSAESVVERLRRAQPQIPIRYFGRRPRLGQARNVDALFRTAGGELLALMHDDDLFEPEALAALAPAFADPRVVAAFGKQRIVDADGRELAERTDTLNREFLREPHHAGVQADGLVSALVQQFPNNGFIVRAEAARAVGYAAGEALGDSCDFAFPVNLARAGYSTFSFVDRYTARYRLWPAQLSCNFSDSALHRFRYLDENAGVARTDAHVQQRLRDAAPAAIHQAALRGLRRQGLRWYFGPWHRRRILTAGGLWRLLLLLLPAAAARRADRLGRRPAP